MPTVLDSLNDGLQRAMAADQQVYLVGEDLLDPYGGAFKVTRGLSSAYPQRVLSSPISEAGIVGLAAGMALRGLRPVVEIMFGDFLALAADQILNHAAKFRWMYADQVRVPLLIRTPMGGRRGYGPTHSQTLEKHFLGVPGLRVLAPTDLGEPGELLKRAVLEHEDPLLFVENKLLYLLPLQTQSSLADFELVEHHEMGSSSDQRLALSAFETPTYSLSLRGAPAPALTLAAYGYMAHLARQAALRLAYEDEIFVRLVVPTQLAPTQLSRVIQSARETGRLLVVEEGSLSLGWGAEVLAQAAATLGPRLQAAQRLAALDLPIPAAGTLEAEVLPDVDQIIAAARQMMGKPG